MPDSNLRVSYSQPEIKETKGQSRYVLPVGPGRVLLIEDLTQSDLYINFGTSMVVASPSMGFKMNYGRAQYLIPDDATHYVLHSDDEKDVVVHLGWAETGL